MGFVIFKFATNWTDCPGKPNEWYKEGFFFFLSGYIVSFLNYTKQAKTLVAYPKNVAFVFRAT